MCIGPLVVRAEGLTLQADGSPNNDGARKLAAQGNLVFENRSGSPVRIAILERDPDILFDNGIRLSAYRRGDISGVFRCERSGPECFQGTPDQFQTLNPGDSPARANVGFSGRMDGSLAASLPQVTSATATLQVYVVDANNVGSVLSVSLPNIAVRNQLSN